MDDIADFDRILGTLIDETEGDLTRILWLSVIVQAILDARGKNVTRLEQARAVSWLAGTDGENGDFATVCDLAGIEFSVMRKRIKELLGDDSLIVDFRCNKKSSRKKAVGEKRKRYFRRAAKNARLRKEKALQEAFAPSLQGGRKREAADVN